MPGMALSPNDPYSQILRTQQNTAASQRLADEDRLKAQQAGYSRGEQQQDFQQSMNQFGDFVNRFLPTADPAQSSSNGSGYPGGGSGGFGATAGTWTPMAVGAPGVQAPTNPESSARIAFARAKDTVGNSLTGLMKALNNQFAGRNISGSTANINAVGNTLLGGNQQLADVAREQAVQETGLRNDWATKGYQGAITQRGQDLGALSDQQNRFVTMRGQDLTAQTAREALNSQQTGSKLALITGLWNAFKGQQAPGAMY